MGSVPIGLRPATSVAGFFWPRWLSALKNLIGIMRFAEYEKWFENVYMDKDFSAEDKDPLDVYTEYFRQNHTAGEWL